MCRCTGRPLNGGVARQAGGEQLVRSAPGDGDEDGEVVALVAQPVDQVGDAERFKLAADMKPDQRCVRWGRSDGRCRALRRRGRRGRGGAAARTRPRTHRASAGKRQSETVHDRQAGLTSTVVSQIVGPNWTSRTLPPARLDEAPG